MTYEIIGTSDHPDYTPYGGAREFMYAQEHETIIEGPAECLAGETILHDYSTGMDFTIAKMSENNISPTILTLSGISQAGVPFCKGTAELYRVVLDNGISFLATLRHLVLTVSGWKFVGDLSVSEYLLECDESHLLSNLEYDQQALLRDVKNFSQITPDCQFGYPAYCHSCDAQPRWDLDNGLNKPPLQVGARVHNYDDLNTDGLGFLSAHIRHIQLFGHLSSDRSFLGGGAPRMDCEEYCSRQYTYVSDDGLFQPPFQSQLDFHLPESSFVKGRHFFDKHLVSCGPPYSDYTVLASAVSSVEYVRTDRFYDLTVPGIGNYIIDGVIHHNTGKTLAACWKVHILACKYPKCQGAIVRKSQKSVYGSVLQTFQRVIEGAPVEIYGGERPDKYTYANGSEIWVGGMDNPDKVLSSERDFVYVNQAEELRLDDWEKLATRTTGRNAVIPYTQIIGDCNPGISLHWIRERSKAGKLNLIKSHHKDNPTLFDPITGEITEQGIRTMGILESLTGVRRKRLLEGIWATAEGAVYDMFDASIHVNERSSGDFTRWMLAIDEGYTNPAVILLIGEDPDGRLHIAREFYRRGVLQSRLVEIAGEWHKERSCYILAVDQAAAGLIADFQDAGLPAQGFRGRVLDGITTVQGYLKVQGDNRPRLTVDPSCVETINEFESYVWKPEKDEPVKEHDHAMDALRYAMKPITSGDLDVF